MPGNPSVFVLGPFLDNVIEPEPIAVDSAGPSGPGRRQISFQDPATTPGGLVNLQLLPPLNPDDVLPVNVYVFFVQPTESVPPLAERTPEWFFKKSKGQSGSVHIGVADEAGLFSVRADGVKPSLKPYFVQVIYEFLGA